MLDSPEQKFQDPKYSAKRRKADFLAVESHISSCLGLKLSDLLAGTVSLPSPAQQLTSAGAFGAISWHMTDLYYSPSVFWFSSKLPRRRYF